MASDIDESTASADRDATAAWATAIGLEDAGPARIDATEKVLLNSLGCDAGRVAAAAAVCRARHADQDPFGWDEAAALLEQVLQRLRDAGADRDEQAAAVRYPAPEGAVPGAAAVHLGEPGRPGAPVAAAGVGAHPAAVAAAATTASRRASAAISASGQGDRGQAGLSGVRRVPVRVRAQARRQ